MVEKDLSRIHSPAIIWMANQKKTQKTQTKKEQTRHTRSVGVTDRRQIIKLELNRSAKRGAPGKQNRITTHESPKEKNHRTKTNRKATISGESQKSTRTKKRHNPSEDRNKTVSRRGLRTSIPSQKASKGFYTSNPTEGEKNT